VQYFPRRKNHRNPVPVGRVGSPKTGADRFRHTCDRVRPNFPNRAVCPSVRGPMRRVTSAKGHVGAVFMLRVSPSLCTSVHIPSRLCISRLYRRRNRRNNTNNNHPTTKIAGLNFIPPPATVIQTPPRGETLEKIFLPQYFAKTSEHKKVESVKDDEKVSTTTQHCENNREYLPFTNEKFSQLFQRDQKRGDQQGAPSLVEMPTKCRQRLRRFT